MPVKTTPILEIFLSLLVVCGIIYTIYFLIVHGYLPEPFFQDLDDTFMDWYNTAFWAHNPGAYDEWSSVYPPLSFDFLKIVSMNACYVYPGLSARSCDRLGALVLFVFVLLNAALIYAVYRKRDPATAAPRALALAFGMPMLFGWERGNLMIPCFTVFALGHGRLLRSAWLKWTCIALSVNFKPYLLVTLFPQVLKLRWRWLEGCAIALAIIYGLSYLVLGAGTPGEIINDILTFSVSTNKPRLNNLDFTTTYAPLLEILRSPLPIMRFTGSRPLELIEHWLPIVTRLGEIGGILCLAGAALRPQALGAYRLAALVTTMLLAVYSPGGYAAVFCLFFLFLEPRKGPALTLAIVVGYALCVPWDLAIVNIGRSVDNAYLSGRAVDRDVSLTVGELVRPALILLVEYGLVLASLADLYRDWRAAPRLDQGAAPSDSAIARPR